MKRKNQYGFSLVELLVVVAIIGVLAGVGIVGYDRYVENTRFKVFEQNIATIVRAVDFEYTVVSNDLASAVDEVNQDGTKTGMKINANSTCEQFVFSIKEHFKEFQNPWFPEKKMITVDSVYRSFHKKGMVQIMCNRSSPSGTFSANNQNSGGFRKGWSCMVQDSNIMIYAHYQDGTTYSGGYSESGSPVEFTASATAGNPLGEGTIIGKTYNRGLVNLINAGYSASDIWNGGNSSFNNGPYLNDGPAEALCPSITDGTPFELASNYNISADANY